MRALAVLFALTLAPAAWAEIEVVRVFTGWREAASFKRISEYFTGVENTAGSIVLRSTPEKREGYYFLVRLRNDGPALPARLRFEVITAESTKPREFAFDTTIPAGRAVFNFGLTGPHWPGRETEAIAWRMVIVDSNEKVLATDKSYLWEKPASAH